MFFFKNHAEDETGRLVPAFFLCFFKNLYVSKKQVICSLVSIDFDNPLLSMSCVARFGTICTILKM